MSLCGDNYIGAKALWTILASLSEVVHLTTFSIGLDSLYILYQCGNMKLDIVSDFEYCNIVICHMRCLLLVLKTCST